MEKAKHAYVEYESTLAWRAVSDALVALETNKDIQVHTGHHLVVGYICKQLEAATRAAADDGSAQPAVPADGHAPGGRKVGKSRLRHGRG